MKYIFEPDILHQIAQEGANLADEERFEYIHQRLAECYPGHISDRLNWVTMSSGGCIYAVAIFHASLTEYLLIFGNSIGTSGHTGRHWTEIYDFVIDGELWYFKEECPYKKIVHQAGDRYYLAPHHSESLRIRDRAWVLEYARGPIISILPFGFAGSIFTTLDFKTILRMLKIYGKLTIKALLRSKQ